MNEIEEAVRLLDTVRDDSELPALVTLVSREGSSYRTPGARMLVWRDGSRLGSVSGGCLEADIVERCARVFETGRPEYQRYDNRGESDAMFEMGCQGALGILIEPLRSAGGFLRSAAQWRSQRHRGALATIYLSREERRARVGARLAATAGTLTHNLDDESLAQSIYAELQPILTDKRPAARACHSVDGSVAALLEPVLPPIALVVSGAGEDARPLVAIAAQLGWIITVADHRPAFLTAQRFPAAHHLLLGRPEELAGTVQVDERTAAVVMNHNYPHDRETLRGLLRSEAGYIGQLGPRRRTARLLAELQNESAGAPLSGERVFAPVGLDIGNDAPEQIALAIVSEIQAHFSGKLPGRG